jgi:hypothetical protein
VRGPFDAQIMYNNTGQKPHGKFAIADELLIALPYNFPPLHIHLSPKVPKVLHREKGTTTRGSRAKKTKAGGLWNIT